MASIKKMKSIIVTGDAALDWQINNFPSHPKNPESNQASPSHIFRNFGGSLLLSDLIAEIVKNQNTKEENWALNRVTIDPASINPEDNRFIKSYASWALSPRTSSAEDIKKPTVWRVKEFLGISPVADPAHQKLENEPAHPEIIVLDDANLGFRNDRSQWPKAISNHRTQTAKRPWVVVKMAKPLVQGELWKELYEKWSDRLIVVISVNDLRLSEVQISSELS